MIITDLLITLGIPLVYVGTCKCNPWILSRLYSHSGHRLHQRRLSSKYIRRSRMPLGTIHYCRVYHNVRHLGSHFSSHLSGLRRQVYLISDSPPSHLHVRTVRNAIKIRRIYSEMRATEYFNGDATANRYFRVMALSCVDLFFTVPSLLFMIVWDSRYCSAWTSWADTKLRAWQNSY